MRRLVSRAYPAVAVSLLVATFVPAVAHAVTFRPARSPLLARRAVQVNGTGLSLDAARRRGVKMFAVVPAHNRDGYAIHGFTRAGAYRRFSRRRLGVSLTPALRPIQRRRPLRAHAATVEVRMYWDINFGGSAWEAGPCDQSGWMWNWNDVVSSLQTYGKSVWLYADPWWNGESWGFASHTSVSFLNEFNDKTSAFVVLC
jgi:hypothetical protein